MSNLILNTAITSVEESTKAINAYEELVTALCSKLDSVKDTNTTLVRENEIFQKAIFDLKQQKDAATNLAERQTQALTHTKEELEQTKNENASLSENINLLKRQLEELSHKAQEEMTKLRKELEAANQASIQASEALSKHYTGLSSKAIATANAIRSKYLAADDKKTG